MALSASWLVVTLCVAAHATLLDALDRGNAPETLRRPKAADDFGTVDSVLSLWTNRARLRTRFEHDLSIADQAELDELPIVEIDSPLTGQSLPSDQLAVHFTIYAPIGLTHIRATGLIGGDSMIHSDVYPTAAGEAYSSGLVAMHLVWKMKRIPASRVELTIRVEEIGHPFRQVLNPPLRCLNALTHLRLSTRRRKPSHRSVRYYSAQSRSIRRQCKSVSLRHGHIDANRDADMCDRRTVT
jgi:hypothetical protein